MPSQWFCLALWLLLAATLQSGPGQTTNKSAVAAGATSDAQAASIKAEMKEAVGQVEKIVNQPVAAYRRAPHMHVTMFKPGWFHPGATKPDFNNVDVRATREAPFDRFEYVSSDLNPGIVFIGRQLEFNSMTKYFYTNRSLPKKKLTEAEMVEINRLYRIIGKCEHELAVIQTPAAQNTMTEAEAADARGGKKAPRLLNPYAGGALLGLAVAILLYSYKRRSG
ncbi:MAG TPA: hypothetical protein VHH88_09945 [Verrucomicrobiae bacterium]|nr:hypothetical protein [Verrucomicrobiae bacterium]